MQRDYYLTRLYPLQDKALQIVAAVPNDFYLTGGTTVSRQLLHHRYSDDLDFFVNRAAGFIPQVTAIASALREAFPDTNIVLEGEDFVRLFVQESDVQLKIEFINDVGYRVAEPLSTPLFIRTDNWQNILANKITALSRNAGKDMADIIFIAHNFSFDWREMIAHAGLKDMWVNELEVSDILYNYPVKKLEEVAWMIPPDYESMAHDLKRIGLDVFEGGPNSLAP